MEWLRSNYRRKSWHWVSLYDMATHVTTQRAFDSPSHVTCWQCNAFSQCHQKQIGKRDCIYSLDSMQLNAEFCFKFNCIPCIRIIQSHVTQLRPISLLYMDHTYTYFIADDKRSPIYAIVDISFVYRSVLLIFIYAFTWNCKLTHLCKYVSC